MHVFIDFWKLETKNSILHVFSFLHKLNFENSFCFLPILSCQTSFLILKIEIFFLKTENKGKKQLPNISLVFSHMCLVGKMLKSEEIENSFVWLITKMRRLKINLIYIYNYVLLNKIKGNKIFY